MIYRQINQLMTFIQRNVNITMHHLRRSSSGWNKLISMLSLECLTKFKQLLSYGRAVVVVNTAISFLAKHFLLFASSQVASASLVSWIRAACQADLFATILFYNDYM